METSDSEYFESADEDFDSTYELNTDKISDIKVLHANLNEHLHKVHIKPGPKENEKQNSVQLGIQNNKINLEGSGIINRTSEEYVGKQIAQVRTVEKSEVGNEEDQTKISQLCATKDSSSDNTWYEEQGWNLYVDDKESEANTVKDALDSSKSSLNENCRQLESKIAKNEENMWENDAWDSWDPIDNEEVGETEIKKSQSNFTTETNIVPSNQPPKSWGGVTSILFTATQGVSTFTSSVSQGLSTVLETGLGVPEPEELAMFNKTGKKSPVSTEAGGNKNLPGFGLGNIGSFVSGVSKLVEITGTKVISGGLDTLETIGKKTMEVIQDRDPGLKKKRAFFNLENEKPVLSQILREAKEKAEQENEVLYEDQTKKVNYESIFDAYQGLVHLEALEMLSKQTGLKILTLIETSKGRNLEEIQETLEQVKELCELPDEEDEEQISVKVLKEKLRSAVGEIGINITYDRLISVWEETESWLNSFDLNVHDEKEIHQQALEKLAQLTALAVEQFHKAGELLLVKEHRSTADEADSLVQLTTMLTLLISLVAAKFSETINSKATKTLNKDEINSIITNIFFEAANSSSYIQGAFQLLVPILQMGAV